MPHCIMECSRPLCELLPVILLQNTVLHGTESAQLFEPGDIKVRAITIDD